MWTTAASGWEQAGTWLSLAILIVAASTLWFTYPKRAKLVVDRLHELETDDLIFFVYPQPNPNGEPQIPRDYLLQLRVAVANVGRRMAVLSAISVEDFTTASGKTTYLPESVQGPIHGGQWTLQMGFSGGQRVFQNISTPGPFVLGPDDVIVIQFRTRRGIDWSNRWDLPTLRQYSDGLSDPFASARVRVAWRRGIKVRRDHFDVKLQVLQQELYVAALKEVTQDFTVRPDIPQMPMQIE